MIRPVVIFRGLPGSGKTYLAKGMQALLGGSIMASDDHMVNAKGEYAFDYTKLDETNLACYRRFIIACDNYHPFVAVHNTGMELRHLTPYVQFARAMHRDVIIVELYSTFDESVERNTHDVPAVSIANMIRKFEPLTWDVARAVSLVQVRAYEHTPKSLVELLGLRSLARP